MDQETDPFLKRFLEMEVQRRLMVLNQRVKCLENENAVLRQRLSDIINGQEDVQTYMKRNGITDMLYVSNNDSGMKNSSSSDSVPSMNGSANLLNLSNSSSTLSLSNGISAPPVPPRLSMNGNGQVSPDPSVGTRLEGLLLDELDDDFNPRAYEQSANEQKTQQHSPVNNTSSVAPPILAPPPKTGRDANRRSSAKNSARVGMDEVFGSAPISTATPRPKPQDPFGMGNFSIPVNGNGEANPDYHNLGLLDKKIMEMKDGFSRGLSISAEDFSLESLDPLKN